MRFTVRGITSSAVSHNYNELPRCKQRGINRNIYNRPKGRGIKPLSAGGLKKSHRLSKNRWVTL